MVAEGTINVKAYGNIRNLSIPKERAISLVKATWKAGGVIVKDGEVYAPLTVAVKRHPFRMFLCGLLKSLFSMLRKRFGINAEILVDFETNP